MHTNQIVCESPSSPFSQAERCSIIKLFLIVMFITNLETFKAEINMFFS